MIAHRIDLLTLHEMVIASAVPNPIPAVAAVVVCAMRGNIHRVAPLWVTEALSICPPFDKIRAP